MYILKKKQKLRLFPVSFYTLVILKAADWPRQTVSTHGITGAGTVALLEAVDQATVQAGFALLQAPVLFEATVPTGHTPGTLSIAKATFLEGLKGKIHRLRGGVSRMRRE